MKNHILKENKMAIIILNFISLLSHAYKVLQIFIWISSKKS